MGRPSVAVIREAGPAGSLLDPIRRALLTALDQPDSAAGLARRLDLPRQRVNYHLRLLERDGLVEMVEERRKGNCVERIVRATAREFIISPEALGSLGDSAAGTADRASASCLMATAARAVREVAALDAGAAGSGKRLATFTLDTEVRFASAERRAAFLEEFTAAFGRIAARYHDEGARGGRAFRVVAFGHQAIKERP